MMLLKDKNVIITGTNRGIGRAILEAFAANGAYILCPCREQTPDFDDLLQKSGMISLIIVQNIWLNTMFHGG
jgi:3-oxoacyl-[acyl-carrier protein] reductase